MRYNVIYSNLASTITISITTTMTTITIAVTAIELTAYIAITPVPAVVVGPMFDAAVTNCDVVVTVI